MIKHKSIRQGIATWVVLLILCNIYAFEVMAQQFEARGSFEFKSYWPLYKDGKDPCLIYGGTFFASISGHQSEVEYKLTNVACMLKMFETRESGMVLAFDGTNFYQKMELDPSIPENSNSLPVETISFGPVPERADNKLSTLWLAYASNWYFKQADSNLIDSPFMNAEDRSVWTNDHRVRAIWSTLPGLPGLPGLPSNLVHTSKFIFLDKEASVTSNIVYNVTATTNVNGMIIPRLFECKNYSSPSRIFNSFSGQLQTIQSNITLASFVPSLPNVSYIIDERFIDNPGNPLPGYFQKSNQWPSLQKGKANLNKSQPSLMRLPQPPVNERARWITRALLCLLTLAPLFWIVLKLTKTKEQNEN